MEFVTADRGTDKESSDSQDSQNPQTATSLRKSHRTLLTKILWKATNLFPCGSFTEWSVRTSRQGRCGESENAWDSKQKPFAGSNRYKLRVILSNPTAGTDPCPCNRSFGADQAFFGNLTAPRTHRARKKGSGCLLIIFPVRQLAAGLFSLFFRNGWFGIRRN